MSRVHYFQRYSQKENVVTNNTLLLFSRLYNHSPARFEDFLNALSGDSNLAFEVGMQFAQQQGNASQTSVPDGVMNQKSCKVVIETKLYGNHGMPQLLNHLDSFNGEDTQVLLLLDPRQPDSTLMTSLVDKVNGFNQENGQNIVCLATTFTDIIAHFDDILFEYDLELKDILEDYRDFCHSMNLVPRDEFMMRAIVTGTTFEDNIKFGVYYDPAERGFSAHEYLGLYRNKSVRGIGRVKTIVHADLDEGTGELKVIKFIKGTSLSEEENQRIVGIMRVAEQLHGWDIYTGHQFFITDGFEPTSFKKATKYPIQRSKYFDLGRVLDLESLPCNKELAQKLKEKTWE
ncbi:hypothetical protein BCT30_17580 [Enterovibrio norvegicus]|uniref:hypothetical protein n=1 Tax=Enterovibrio norvegicus TaxID=188144 RepID=UPI000C85ED26|nr:hypothetical protein [Enterovibrio norvegicus]MCC4796723.1 hypothetical protein [Enterovibrio norvegicus]PMI37308.1 hypothetical protein BCU46_11745 [Enterovibrio norvegicus]PMN49898.1 hypothetical protein BCT30_17580 [Enterovibrio norvegicus]